MGHKASPNTFGYIWTWTQCLANDAIFLPEFQIPILSMPFSYQIPIILAFSIPMIPQFSRFYPNFLPFFPHFPPPPPSSDQSFPALGATQPKCFAEHHHPAPILIHPLPPKSTHRCRQRLWKERAAERVSDQIRRRDC